MSQNARYDEEQATLRRARILGLSYFDTTDVSQKPIYKNVLPIQDMYQNKLVPLQADDHNITFGVTNTTSQATMNNLKQRFLDQRISFALISDAGFRDYMRRYDPPKQVEYKDIKLTNAGSEQLLQNVSSILQQVNAKDMLAYLVQQAHKLKASDIHTESQRDYVRIRLRIDGVLHPIAKITHQKYHILVSAIASAANISTQAPEAQQGHIAQKLQLDSGDIVDINLRIETVPTINGMDIVMRLFNMRQDMYKLDNLGLSGEERKVVDEIISRPSGLVLVIGPTGSGKTTTLYSMLNSLNQDSRKIITIEDPVEYQFEGLSQISVNSKNSQDVSFGEKLRAVLRLDPDIVMVGEIRDMDTAKTALQASLTGHLVLSTFHASSASAALARLMDVIGSNPLFASAIRLVMAQRLVRKLDNNSKVEYQPSEEEKQYIQSVLDTMPENVQKPDLNNLKLFKPQPSADNPYGYKGQLAVREQFIMNEEILKLLQGGNTSTSTQEIEQNAVKSGMKTMLHDGILKVCAGQTTLDEISRVLG